MYRPCAPDRLASLALYDQQIQQRALLIAVGNRRDIELACRIARVDNLPVCRHLSCCRARAYRADVGLRPGQSPGHYLFPTSERTEAGRYGCYSGESAADFVAELVCGSDPLL